MKIMRSISPIITTYHVVREKKPVTFAYRTPRGELFLLSRDTIRSEHDFVRDINWDDLVASDESLEPLGKLSPNYAAFRNTPAEPWQVNRITRQTRTGSYIDQHLEWISKMYVDGYFTGGAFPHWIYVPRHPELYGIINLIIGLFLAVMGFYIYHNSLHGLNDNVIILWLVGAIFIWMGGRLIRRSRKQ